jgi:hypothetical protein
MQPVGTGEKDGKHFLWRKEEKVFYCVQISFCGGEVKRQMDCVMTAMMITELKVCIY